MRLDAFLNQLVVLPLASWLMIGEALVAAQDNVFVRQRAYHELETSLARKRLGVAVWMVRDAVDTAACLAARAPHAWSRQDRAAFAAACAGAETAALALLAHNELQSETFSSLLAPFATVAETSEGNHSPLSPPPPSA